jgi:hypothetical protein
MNWFHLAENRGQVAGSCEHSNEPLNSIKLLGNSGVAERLAASQEGLSSMELVS